MNMETIVDRNYTHEDVTVVAGMNYNNYMNKSVWIW